MPWLMKTKKVVFFWSLQRGWEMLVKVELD